MDEAASNRQRVVTWSDPKAAARAGRGMAGIDYLRAVGEATGLVSAKGRGRARRAAIRGGGGAPDR